MGRGQTSRAVAQQMVRIERCVRFDPWSCGIVTLRQLPETDKGVIFVTLEDEIGSVNIIVWRQIRERQCLALLRSRLLAVTKRWRAKDGGTYSIARRLVDVTLWFGILASSSRDFHCGPPSAGRSRSGGPCWCRGAPPARATASRRSIQGSGCRCWVDRCLSPSQLRRRNAEAQAALPRSVRSQQLDRIWFALRAMGSVAAGQQCLGRFDAQGQVQTLVVHDFEQEAPGIQ